MNKFVNYLTLTKSKCQIFNSNAFETGAVLTAPVFYFALKLPMTAVKKVFFCSRVSKFISRLSIND